MNAIQKRGKKGVYYRLSAECRRRIDRAKKRTGKSATRILEEAILAAVPLYAKEIQA